MYDSGLKISVFRSSKKVWQQEGNAITFKRPTRIKYEDEDEHKSECVIARKDANCLSFTFDFNPIDDYVYFAYCIPYSYSFLLHSI